MRRRSIDTIRLRKRALVVGALCACANPYAAVGAGEPQAQAAGPNDDLPVIDVHNHDAVDSRYIESMRLWERYGIVKVVLFGNVSEPAARATDAIAIESSREHPDRIIPFVAGVDIHSPAGLDYVRHQFAEGAQGVGEIVAMSAYSPVVSRVQWKGLHLLDGTLPQLYALCAEYGRPILLHIDPPDGGLEEVAKAYPDTLFIFGHGNAFNTPERLERLLRETRNVYIDFFAGFTAFNEASGFTLDDFVPLIEAYPDRFLLGSDSGYGVGYEHALIAMRRLLNLLGRDVAEKVAHRNFEALMARARK